MRRSSMGLGVLAVVVACVPPLAAQAPSGPGARTTEPAGPSLEALEAGIAELEARRGAEDAAGRALAHARRAVQRARSLQRAGDVQGAQRARQIAAAALLWAQRRVAVVAERAAHRMAAERLARARARWVAAEEALRHATRRRDRVLEGEALPPAEQASRDGETP